MKMKKILSFVTLILLFFSCQNDQGIFWDETEENNKIENLIGVQHDIMVNILTNRYNGFSERKSLTRAAESIELTPYVESGDTLLYIAQYEEGWELYSASLSTGMLIFSSDKGKFDINDPNMPESMKKVIRTKAQAVKDIQAMGIKDVDTSWGASAITDEDLSEGKITVKTKSRQRRVIRGNDMPPGHWVLIGTEVLDDYQKTSPKLIKTKWGQTSPWYSFTPYKFFNGAKNHTLVGCVAVACGQYMFYTHYKENIPESAVCFATTTSDGLDFTFSGISNTVWDGMAISSSDISTNLTAIFLGYVGRQLHSSYGIYATGSGPEYSIPYLTSVYGIEFTREPFSFDKIVSTIDKGYPVITDAWSYITTEGTNSNVGHYFITDQYSINSSTTKYIYGWERDPWDYANGEDPYESNDVDENGNVITWAYTNEVVKTYTYNKVSMNWGYDGSDYDKVFYYADGNWSYDKIVYDKDTFHIHVRSDLK